MQTTRSNRRRAQIVVGLLLALGGANLPLSTWGDRLRIFGPLVGKEVLWWVLVAAVLLYVMRIEQHPLSSIGLRRFGIWGVLSAIAAGMLMVVGIVVIYSVVFPAFDLRMNVGAMNQLVATPFWYRFLLVTRAAVGEETLFRA